MSNFKDFLSRLLYEEKSTTEFTESTTEEMAEFEASVSEQNCEDVSERAKAIITDSQIEADNDEYPDISNVQTALETAGSSENHELIRRMLINYAGCNPDELEKDGVKRKEAIQKAIADTKQQADTLKATKAKEEAALKEAEKNTEAAYTEAINQANVACEQAIEEEKQRSAAIIAEIRQKADDATAAAKQERDERLEALSLQRNENEALLRNSNALVVEIEAHGNLVIKQIDEWLSYLK